MELTDVAGVGATKAERLRGAGIASVKDLAEIDLRKKWDVGIGDEVLKRAKQAARRLCDQEGIAYAKAPYGKVTTGPSNKAAKPSRAVADAKKARAKGASPSDAGHAEAAHTATNGTTNGATKKRGFLARLFKRA